MATKTTTDTRTALTRALDALSSNGHGSAASALADLVSTIRTYLVVPPGPPEHVRDKLSAALQRLGELPTPDEVLSHQAAQYKPPPSLVERPPVAAVKYHELPIGALFTMRGSPLVWKKTSGGMRRPAHHDGQAVRIAITASVYPHTEEPKPMTMPAANARTAAPRPLSFSDLRISDRFYVRADLSGGVYRKSSGSAAEKPGGGTTKIGARTHVYRYTEPFPELPTAAPVTQPVPVADIAPPAAPAAFVEACTAAVRQELAAETPPEPAPTPPDEPVALVMVRTAVDVHVRDFNRDNPAANYTPADAIGEFACSILGPMGLVSLIASLANSLAHGKRAERAAS